MKKSKRRLKHGIKEIELVVASSIGADLAMAFLTDAKIPVKYIFFDGGQFAQIGKMTRRIMVPFLYLAIKSVYWSKGKTLKKIMWCDDDTIKPYFTEAGRNITYGNLKRQLQSPLFLRVCRKNKKMVDKRGPFEYNIPCQRRGSKLTTTE